MYDINRAMRKMRPLVKQMARKHAVSGSTRMGREDLEAEGMLVLMKCCKKFSSGNFEHYFARAFRNYIDKIRTYGNRPMRRAVEEIPIEFLEDQERIGMQHRYNTHTGIFKETFLQSQRFVRDQNEQRVVEDLQRRAKRLLPLLSSGAVRLLQMVVDPRHTAEAEQQAYHEFLRRKHLRALGIRCPGRDQFRLKKRHFQKALGMNSSELRSAIREIQSVDSTLQRGGSRWPRSK